MARRWTMGCEMVDNVGGPGGGHLIPSFWACAAAHRDFSLSHEGVFGSHLSQIGHGNAELHKRIDPFDVSGL